jgi:hypothetical protein
LNRRTKKINLETKNKGSLTLKRVMRREHREWGGERVQRVEKEDVRDG